MEDENISVSYVPIIVVSGPGRDLAKPLLSTVGMQLLLNEHFTRYSGVTLVYTLCVCVVRCVYCI